MKSASLHKQRFGKLTVYRELSFRDKHSHKLWFSGCDCGGVKIAKTGDLTTGRVKSCGCLKNPSGPNNPAWKGGKINTPCSYCGKEKEVYPNKPYEKTFCDNTCRGNWMVGNVTGSNNGKWKPKVEVACAVCGKTREIYESHFKSCTNFFCGNECSGKWRAINMTGKDNPNYNGGSPEQRKVGQRINAGIRKALKGGKDGYSWEKLLGYTRKQLFEHLSKTMPDGYTWENMDDLHIDHIIPKSAFNFDSYQDADFQRCWALKNLRLLPAVENMQKSCKLQNHFQPGLKLQFMQRSGKTIKTNNSTYREV